MTDITISAEVATAAVAALRSVGDNEVADAIELRLNPPSVWYLATILGDDGYNGGLSKSCVAAEGYVMPKVGVELLAKAEADNVDVTDLNALLKYDDDALEAFGFVRMGSDIALFTDEQKDAFDLSVLPGEWATDDFEEAPTRDDGTEAYAIGNTELDHCEGLISLGDRADDLRYGVSA